MDYQYLILNTKDAIGTIWFNRPEVHNAFHFEMIKELTAAVEEMETNDAIRVVIIRGQGKSFCAGADLDWMKKATDYTVVQNYEESLGLSNCLYKLHTLSKPTIALVNGAVFGGGNGLMTACDFVYAYEGTRFSLSEVKLGLIPACISPYVIKKMGESNARKVMLRGSRLEVKEAQQMGLIDTYGWTEQVDQDMQSLINDLMSAGPKALAQTKALIQAVTDTWSMEEAKDQTAQWIADIRQTEEAQEGMKAFFEKRKPNWMD